MKKKWLIIAVILLGIVLGLIAGIYTYRRGGISEMNMVNNEKLAEIIEEESEINEKITNIVIETAMMDTSISPNAIIIEKRYYTGCDHIIKKIVDIPKGLVNKKEADVKKEYADWKLEGYSPTEIVVYKEIKGICDEHYVVKEHNGVIGIYTENNEGILEWKEDTEVMTQYLPEEDIENLKAGVKVIGKMNLTKFLEDYE